MNTKLYTEHDFTMTGNQKISHACIQFESLNVLIPIHFILIGPYFGGSI
jgi:hypothetical protein